MPRRADESVEDVPPLPFASNPSAIVVSWTDGRKPSGTFPSPFGVTRLVTVSTPSVASSARTVSRRRASDAGASMSVEPVPAMSAVDWVIRPLPRCWATMS